MATYSLIVGGTEYSHYLEQDTWSVDQNFGRQGATAHFQLMDDWSLIGTPQVTIKALQEVSFKDTGTGDILFSGYVTSPNITTFSPTCNEWVLPCIDYTLRADNIIVFNDLYNISADNMILALVANGSGANLTARPVSQGGKVYPGPILGRMQFPYVTLSSALTKISRLSSQQTDYSWFVDYNREVNWFSLAQTPPPLLTLTDYASELAGGVTKTLADYDAAPNAFSYQWDGASIRNSCIVRGSNLSNVVTDRFVGNGSTNTWPLSYIVDSSVSSPILTVAGIRRACTVITQGSGFVTHAPEEWIITQNAIGTWILTPANASTPHTGQAVIITYTSTSPIITRQDNGISQSVYADSRGAGIYQSYISDPTLTTLSSASARAQGELQEFQWVQERVKISTNETWQGHINAGQTFVLHSGRTPNSQAGYTQGLTPAANATFLIVQNHISGKQGGFRKYSVTGTRIS